MKFGIIFLYKKKPSWVEFPKNRFNDILYLGASNFYMYFLRFSKARTHRKHCVPYAYVSSAWKWSRLKIKKTKTRKKQEDVPRGKRHRGRKIKN
jgi:hypothetical protein